MALPLSLNRIFSVLILRNTFRGTAASVLPFVCFSLLATASWATPLGPTAHFGGNLPIGSGFSAPNGVAVDRNGNVFIANQGNSTVSEVVAVDGVVSSSSVVKTVGSGFNQPDGVAVDGSGNVFVADMANNAIYEIVAAGGVVSSSSAVNAIGSGFNQPQGVAVDGSGNVLVADSGNAVVKEIVAVGGVVSSSSVVNTIGSGFSQPTGVAVDGNGNVFVADYNNSAVYEIFAVGGVVSSASTVNPIGSGFSGANGVAVDRSGNVFVADYNNNAVKEIAAVSGLVSSSSVVNTLGSGFSGPTGVAVDGDGNVFVVDQGNNMVKEIVIAPRKLPATAVNSTSVSLSIPFTFDNGGSIGAPVVLTQGATGLDYADAGTGRCTTNGISYSYNTGDTCTVDVTFTPRYPGQQLGAVQLEDTNGNPIATAYVHGMGIGPQVVFGPGAQTTTPLAGALSQSGITGPTGIAFDAEQNVYAVDGSANKLVKISSQGVATTLLASGLSDPVGVAIDGAGNIYVTNFDSGTVLEIPPAGGTTTTVATGLPRPYNIAIDGQNNIYIATSSGIVELPYGGTQKTLLPGVSARAVAVDSIGNLYVGTDTDLIDLPAGGGTQQTLLSGLSTPDTVLLDAAGNIYIADTFNSRFLEIPAGGGTPLSLGSGWFKPAGMAVDASGNIFVTALGNLYELNRTNIALRFPTPTAINSTDTTDGVLTVTVANSGNDVLNFPVPTSGNNPNISENFTLDSTSSGTCPLTTGTQNVLAAGATCMLPISFTPIVGGIIGGSLVLTDTNLNANPSTTQTISLNGTAQLLTPTLVFATIPDHTYGDTPFIVSATSASSGSVTYTVTSGPATITGNTLTITGTGTVTLSASQAATSNYATATTTASFAVEKEAATGVVNASSTAVTSSQSATLTATFMPVTHGSPSGTVTFYDNGDALGSAVALVNGAAQYATSTLALGQHIITASYSGDANFLSNSAIPSITITVSAAPAQNFSMDDTAGPSNSQSVVRGGAATFTFSLAPMNGAYPGVVTFTATGLPVGATATFSPSSIAANGGAQTVTLTIQTSALAELNQPMSHHGGLIVFALLFLPLAGTRRTRRAAQKLGGRMSLGLLLLISLGAVAGLTGCNGTPNPSSQLPQSYTVTVTATSGSVQHSSNVTLQVQ